MKRRTRRIVLLVLVIAIIATMLIGCVSAATNYSFWLSLPAYGVTDLATPREKESSLSYAYFNLTTVTNNTGYNLYINVRSSDGSTIVGTAATVYGTGSYYVYYLPGYGNVGTYYRPSGQTSSYSSKAAYIEGRWRP